MGLFRLSRHLPYVKMPGVLLPGSSAPVDDGEIGITAFLEDLAVGKLSRIFPIIFLLIIGTDATRPDMKVLFIRQIRKPRAAGKLL